MRIFTKSRIFLLMACLLSFSAWAQTSLSPGDLAFTGFRADGIEDWSFILFTDIIAGTVIRFTDRGWTSSNAFFTAEGTKEITFASDVSCGTEVYVNTSTNTATTSAGTVGTMANVPGGSLALAASGDQLFAYQGSDASPTFIAGVNFDGTEGTPWQSTATNSNTSALPSGLTNGVNAVGLGETDNAYFNCTGTVAGTISVVSGSIHTAANWTVSNSRGGINVPSGCDYSGLDCGASDCDPPNAVCNLADLTISLNQGNSIEPGDIDVGSTADCGLSSLTVSPNTFDCTQVGTSVTVTLTVVDINMDVSTCTGGVQVNGLPCGYTLTDINCEEDTYGGFGSQTETFYLETLCSETMHYRSNDSQGFIQTSICGDGEIIAQVTEVEGAGFAGIAMREGSGPSEKMIEIGIDGISLTRRSLRQSTGGIAFNHLFQTQGRIWLRLTRTGNTFAAYHSLDGSNWQTVFITNIPMSSCIVAGLYATSSVPGDPFAGYFNNVSTTGGSLTLQVPTQALDIVATPSQEVRLFPNPATDAINVDLQKFVGQSISITIFNVNGQVVKSLVLDEVQQGTQNVNIHTLHKGTYLMRIESAESVISKKFIISDK